LRFEAFTAEMGRSCNKNEKMNAYRILLGKARRKERSRKTKT
jgi:hypothetical protein